MVAPEVSCIDLFKIADRCISGWVKSFKIGSEAASVKGRFCSLLEDRLLWLEFHPLLVSYPRTDISSQFAVISIHENSTAAEARGMALEEQVQTGSTPTCTFSETVSIKHQRFLDSGTRPVECPNCAKTHSFSPSKGILRFLSHDIRNTNAPLNSQRWAMREAIWKTVGGEST